MSSIIIEFDRAVAKIDITKEQEISTFVTFTRNQRIEELVVYFATNNTIASFSSKFIDGKENIVFKDSKNTNTLTFVFQSENEELVLNYISYLIGRYNEARNSYYEQEKEVQNINIALSTTNAYYEKANDETTNYVIYINNEEVSAEDLNFVTCILEELIFNTQQSVTRREKENIILVRTEEHLITIPKILFLRVDNIIRKRRELKKLAFKKEGNKNENGRFS